LFPLLIGSDTT